jgi:hypothetical protein
MTHPLLFMNKPVRSHIRFANLPLEFMETSLGKARKKLSGKGPGAGPRRGGSGRIAPAFGPSQFFPEFAMQTPRRSGASLERGGGNEIAATSP